MLDYDPETRIKPLEAIHHPFFRKDGSLLHSLEMNHGGSQPFYPPHIPTQTVGTSSASSTAAGGQQEPMIISQEIVSLDANQPFNHMGQSSELISGRHIKLQYSPPPPTAFPPNDHPRGLHHPSSTNPYPIPMNIGHPVPICVPNHLSPHHSIGSSYSPKIGSHSAASLGFSTGGGSGPHNASLGFSTGGGSGSSPSMYNPFQPSGSAHQQQQRNGGSLPQQFYGTNALFNENDPQFSFSFSPSSSSLSSATQPKAPPPGHASYPSSRMHRDNASSHSHSYGKSNHHKRTANGQDMGGVGSGSEIKDDSPMMGIMVHR